MFVTNEIQNLFVEAKAGNAASFEALVKHFLPDIRYHADRLATTNGVDKVQAESALLYELHRCYEDYTTSDGDFHTFVHHTWRVVGIPAILEGVALGKPAVVSGAFADLAGVAGREGTITGHDPASSLPYVVQFDMGDGLVVDLPFKPGEIAISKQRRFDPVVKNPSPAPAPSLSSLNLSLFDVHVKASAGPNDGDMIDNLTTAIEALVSERLNYTTRMKALQQAFEDTLHGTDEQIRATRHAYGAVEDLDAAYVYHLMTECMRVGIELGRKSARGEQA